MKKLGVIVVGVLAVIIVSFNYFISDFKLASNTFEQNKKQDYWLILHRKSNKELLYKGSPGDVKKSMLMRTFSVKSGIPGERPTPLPKLAGRDYWLLIEKHAEEDSETTPYFITLDIPASTDEPYGPVPYLECDGKQCNWQVPGAFGLHGVNGNKTKLSAADRGSSGCVRHTNEDITYLYNLLDFSVGPVKYYVKDI